MSDENNDSVDTEQLKNDTKEAVNQVKEETKATVNEVKDTIKNVNLKDDAKETSSYVKKMISDPIGEVRQVARDEQPGIFKNVIILMIVFIAASVLIEFVSLFKYGKLHTIGDNIMNIISSVLNPVLYIVIPSIIMLLLNKNGKKLTTIISTTVVARIPVIITYVLDILVIFVSEVSIVISPISTALSSISIILYYYGMKELYGKEEGEGFFKQFAIVIAISSLIFFILAKWNLY